MDQRQTPPQSTAAGDGLASRWPSGWYVYENGRVDGPFTAEVAFALEAETSDGKPRLVSRKGFSQWYALRDLGEIFRMTAQLGQKVAQQEQVTEAQLSGLASGMQSLQSSDRKSCKGAKVKGKRVDTTPSSGAMIPVGTAAPVTQAETALIALTAAPLAQATSVEAGEWTPDTPNAAPLTDGSDEETERHALSLDDDALDMFPDDEEEDTIQSRGAETEAYETDGANVLAKTHAAERIPATAKQPRALKQTSATKQTNQAMLMQEYFLARGRLRLGKLRSPWVSAFLGVPLSLGVVWAQWFGALAREVAFHCRNEDKSPLPHAALAIIPGFHFYMVWRLATLINEMEAQNRYKRVSPKLATMFALLPPFAMVYLQDCVNRHWMLHAQHAVMAKAAKAG